MRWPLIAIETGAGLFILALLVTIAFDPRVWLLHVLQSLIYVGVIVLARRDSNWGYGAGLTVALLWNGANLFVTGFIAAGVSALRESIATGHLVRPVYLLLLTGAFGHLLMIAGCLVCFLRRRPRLRQWGELLGGAVLLFLALLAIFPLRTHKKPLPLDIGAAIEREHPPAIRRV